MAAAAVVAAVLPLAPSVIRDRGTDVAIVWPSDRTREALRHELERGGAPAPIAEFYRARKHRPLWVSHGRLDSGAKAVLASIEGAAADGLAPQAYSPAALRAAMIAAANGDPRALARADVALSRAYALYVSDLHRPPPGGQLAWRDPALAPPMTDPRRVLEAAAAAPDLRQAVVSARRMHPIYEELRAQLAARRRDGEGPSEDLILANMARARALPPNPGSRYILVDAAAQRMWLYERGRVTDSMRTIVGTPRDQTPAMAGLMRYANFRPYWNIPEDIVREEIAPRVLRDGTGYITERNMQILSGWSRDARVLDPGEVDWPAVASGAVSLRMRRLPGEMNVLGQVKLMLPNPLGIYLHDTPNKAPFRQPQRTLSHGCIRLEDAMRLTRRLVGPTADHPPPGDDVRVDLREPVPVYVVYFTLAPGPQGLERRPDIYRRDAPLLAQLGRGERAAAD